MKFEIKTGPARAEAATVSHAHQTPMTGKASAPFNLVDYLLDPKGTFCTMLEAYNE